MAIPKIIHYCWLSDDPVPTDLQHYMATWKEKLHDYEFIKWDLTRFDINSSVWVKEAFENKKYAFAADYIRLYALYNYGGFYLDMDVEVLKSFDPFLCLNSAVGWQKDKDGLEVAAFGVEKGCEWIRECLNYYSNKTFVLDNGSFDTKILPLIVYNTLHINGYDLIDVHDIRDALLCNKKSKTIPVFREDFFSPKSYETGIIQITNCTYCIHQFAGSWLPLRKKLFMRVQNCLGLRNTGLIVKLKGFLKSI